MSLRESGPRCEVWGRVKLLRTIDTDLAPGHCSADAGFEDLGRPSCMTRRELTNRYAVDRHHDVRLSGVLAVRRRAQFKCPEVVGRLPLSREKRLPLLLIGLVGQQVQLPVNRGPRSPLDRVPFLVLRRNVGQLVGRVVQKKPNGSN